MSAAVCLCYVLFPGKTLDRDCYMSAADAAAWGLIDKVEDHRPLETAVTS